MNIYKFETTRNLVWFPYIYKANDLIQPLVLVLVLVVVEIVKKAEDIILRKTFSAYMRQVVEIGIT